MRTSAERKYESVEQYVSRDPSSRGYNLPSMSAALANTPNPPRFMEPEPSRSFESTWQQEGPATYHPNRAFFSPSRRDDNSPEIPRRLPGVEALLSPEPQFDPQPPRNPTAPSYYPSGPRPNWNAGYANQSLIPPSGQRGDPRSVSLPTSPFSRDEHQRSRTLVVPQYTTAGQSDRRADSLPVSGQFSNAVPPATINSDFAPPPGPRSVYDSRPPPQCIGKREVEGEGICWIFDDGTYYKTEVDGEPVNPQWGITKAGKARKRLAQACLTCREKKIKCEPGFPKCSQCEKTGKICKRTQSPTNSAPDSQVSSQSIHASTTDINDTSTSPAESHSSGRKRARILEHDSISLDEDMTDDGSASRRSIDSYDTSLGKRMSIDSLSDAATLGRLQISTSTPPAYSFNFMTLGLETDVYRVDPELTLHFLDLYFKHVNTYTFGLFGRNTFIKWVKSQQHKCHEEMMLLYSVLAAGSLFSTEAGFGNRLAEVATDAIRVRVGNFSLKSIQTRQMLAVCAFAKGRPNEALDYAGAAWRGITLNMFASEDGIQSISEADQEHLQCGMTAEQLMESRRRTFWSSYNGELYKSLTGNAFAPINSEDIFTRLPCPDRLFDDNEIPEMPSLDRISHNRQELGGLGYLAQIATLGGDYATNARRAKRRTGSDYACTYESLRSTLLHQLEKWHTALPQTWKCNLANLNTSLEQGYGGLFLDMHSIYHIICINLHRYVLQDSIPKATQSRNLLLARQSAQTLLSMGLRLHEIPTQMPSSLFPGHAMLMAVDTLSAGGRISGLPGLLHAFLNVVHILDEPTKVWASIRHQQSLLKQRNAELVRLTGLDKGSRSGRLSNDQRHWRLDNAIDNNSNKDCDIVYGASDEVFFEAIAGEAED
ncbi:MAG: hypothetical protein M1820_001582 [Bogoriella megaspora]|nr:MAG: hypothetical protein M1820_001582 [Bogoriella megaspora]